MSQREVKADLSLLKQMVSELDKQLEKAYQTRSCIGDEDGEAYKKFIIELYAAVGLLSGIAQESSLLMGDLQKLMKYAVPKDENAVSSILDSFLAASAKKSGTRN